jgi:hypothetical protein
MSDQKKNDGQQQPHAPSGVRMLPIVTIKGKRYFVDERLREYRAVENPHDRIPME